MPVRIYEIAKKLGVESKVVLAKAKDLGITNARVPSSSLDKITAEYLEEQLGFVAPAPAVPEAATPGVAAAEGGVPGEPGATVPVAVAPEAPALAEPAAVESAVGAPPGLEAAAPVPAAAPAPEPLIEIPPAVAPAAPAAPSPEVPVELPSPAVTAPPAEPSLAVEPAPVPVASPVAETPVSPVLPAPVPPPAALEVSAATPGSVASEAAAPPSPAVVPSAPPPAAAVPPPPPAEPPRPKIGDKVGFIDLGPGRVRATDRGATRGGVRPGTARPEPTRGRDGREPGVPARPGAGAGRPGVGGGVSARGPARAAAAAPALPTGAEITLRPPIIVRDLAERMGKKPFQVIADLMEQGVFATVNQAIEPEVAQRVCAKHNFRFKVERRAKGEGVHAPVKKEEPLDPEDRPEDLQLRAPVVTIMGHVDHGKTTLLDVIRKSNVAAGEAGGITQHIGAYTIAVPHPERKGELQQITFLDTPGHAAFSAMRARGANVTDIVVLVVAANDGVMPQTLEALSHAQAAGVPIVVAVNKCDHPNANPMLVRSQLQEKGLIPDEWGGNTFFVDVSALTRQGVDRLLEILCFQADLLELKANPRRLAKGNVVESGLEPGGPTATVLVRNGTLRVGNLILCGEHYGRVRALINEENKRLKEAGPSVAVRVLGLNGVPEAGIPFIVIESEKEARAITAERAQAAQHQDKAPPPTRTLENLLQQLSEESAKVLKVIVKADTQGSVEAIVDALRKIDSDKVSLEVIHHAVGTVTERDVMLGSASKGVILGFHTRVDSSAAELAKREGVQIKLYSIIYELVDQVKEAMAGLLEPTLKESVFGAAEVRKVFELSKGGNVAGCVVLNGRLVRGKARVMRRRNLIFEGVIQTLRRFQDEVNEVRAGMECGIRLDGFDQFEVGDHVECYTLERIAAKL